MADIQIHELTALNRNPSDTDVLAIDTGSLTLKVTYSVLSAAIAQLTQDGAIADTYSVSSSYAVGDYVVRNGNLYRCITAIPSGEAWTSSHWTAVKVGDELKVAYQNDKDIDERMQTLEDGTGAYDDYHGELLHIDPSIDARIRDVILYGKSTQSGTPTPSAPVAINTAGDGGTLGVVSSGKNLLDFGYGNLPSVGSTYTHQGVTFTRNSDGSITVRGTATNDAYCNLTFTTNSHIQLFSVFVGKSMTGTVSGLVTGTGLYFQYLNTSGTNATFFNLLSNGSNTATVPANLKGLRAFISVTSGSTVNTTIYPMLRLASITDAAFETPTVTTYPVTVPSTGLPGIAVSSGGNYTDSTGQQWICDTVDLGNGVYTQRVAKVVYDNTTTVSSVTSLGSDVYRISGIAVSGSPSSKPYHIGDTAGYCSHAPYLESWSVASVHGYFDTIAGNLYVPSSIATTKEAALAWIAAQYTAGTPVTFVYILATPVETPLTDAQITRLRAISTRKNETYMYTDGGSGMYVENFVNEKDLTDHLENTIEVLAIKPTATGSIASFSDGSDGLPVKDLTIAINPKQAGSGDPSPSNVRAISGWTGANVTRAGKNLLNPEIYGNPLPYTNRQVTYSKVRDGVYHANGTATGGASYWNVSFKVGVDGAMPAKHLVGKNLYFSTNVDNIACTIGYFKADGTTSGLTNGSQLPNDAVGLRCYVSVASGVSIDTDFSVQLEIGSTGTVLEPYAGTTYPITFPAAAGTVYGGSLDVTTGLLTVDRAMIDIGSTAWTKSASPSSVGGSVFTKTITSLTPPMAPRSRYAENTMLSDRFKTGDSNLWYINYMADYEMLSNETSIYISDSDYDNANDFRTSMSGVMLCYELATPITYQCTPTEVSTLLGANNIWADTGDSTVTYLADTKMYIDNAIAAL